MEPKAFLENLLTDLSQRHIQVKMMLLGITDNDPNWRAWVQIEEDLHRAKRDLEWTLPLIENGLN
jgi:hypothetical protein